MSVDWIEAGYLMLTQTDSFIEMNNDNRQKIMRNRFHLSTIIHVTHEQVITTKT